MQNVRGLKRAAILLPLLFSLSCQKAEPAPVRAKNNGDSTKVIPSNPMTPVPTSPIPTPNIPPPDDDFEFTKTVEAESGKLAGVEIMKNTAGSETYVTSFDADTDSVTVEFDVPKATVYGLEINYRSTLGDKETELDINAELGPKINLKTSQAFTSISAGKIYLKEGTNTIRLRKGWGYYDIDSFVVHSIKKSSLVRNIPDVPVTPNASPGAVALWTYLKSTFGKKIISGQTNAHGDEGAYILQTTGKMPAMSGFDLLFYSGTSYLKGAGDGSTEKAIEWHNQKNGIVTFVWHWFAPSGNKGTTDKYFYTDNTDFDVSKAVVAGTKENTEIMVDLKRIGDQLEKLQKANVPVLWRPLHEAEGAWFWWGAKGPEACVKLYKIVFNYLTVERKLNNLIWIWNSSSPAWYPGNEMVDIVGLDIYHNNNSDDPSAAAFDQLSTLVDGKRLITMPENDSIPDPDKALAFDATWSWFNTWNGEFILTEKYNSKEKLKKIFNSDLVITLDELPDLRK